MFFLFRKAENHLDMFYLHKWFVELQSFKFVVKVLATIQGPGGHHSRVMRVFTLCQSTETKRYLQIF